MTDESSPRGAGRADDAASARWQGAEITHVARLTPRVVGIRLRPERWSPFLAGQHINVRLTAPDGYQAQRSYSIASSPTDVGTIELVIEALADGEVSSYFHDVAAPGDLVEVAGPFAEHFVWRPEDPAPVLLAAGGSGVAPFLAMIRQRATLEQAPSTSAAPTAPMHLIYSARTWNDVIARDELIAHARQQRGFGLTLCLTRDVARRAEDHARRIDRAIVDAALVRLGTTATAGFVCGANSFVGRVSALLIDAGLPPQGIRTERYGGA